GEAARGAGRQPGHRLGDLDREVPRRSQRQRQEGDGLRRGGERPAARRGRRDALTAATRANRPAAAGTAPPLGLARPHDRSLPPARPHLAAPGAWLAPRFTYDAPGRGGGAPPPPSRRPSLAFAWIAGSFRCSL